MASETTFGDWYFAFSKERNRTPSQEEVWNAALASRNEPPAVDAGENEAWLIEDQDHFPRHRWLRIVDTGKTAHLQWENDANTATHFGRREDAVAFQKLHVDFCALSIVTGHTFLNTPALASREEAPAAGAHADLMRFYKVDSADALIAAQADHIEKLQSKLQPAPSLAPQRIREG